MYRIHNQKNTNNHKLDIGHSQGPRDPEIITFC